MVGAAHFSLAALSQPRGNARSAAPANYTHSFSQM